MSEHVRPDLIHRIDITDGVLELSAPYDILHRWRSFDFNILRYWDMQDGKLCNIVVDDGGAEFLIDIANLFQLPRTFFYKHEHEMYLKWRTDSDLSEFEAQFAGIGETPEEQPDSEA